MFLTDFFFPKFCLGCGRVGVYICLICRGKLAYLDRDSCFYCGKMSLFGLTHPGCQRKNGVDGSMAIFYYNNFLKKIIKNIKYRLVGGVWKELVLTIKPEQLLKINFYKKRPQNNNLFLQPIPLHPKRLRERGFNQATLITRFFQQFLALPTVEILQRIKETKPQAQISTQKNRRFNLKKAFSVNNRGAVVNHDFVLVDDLLTSGQTVESATSALKKAGAHRVFVLTLAKG